MTEPQPPSPSPIEVRVVGAAIVRDRRCLATRRGPNQRFAGYYEFPGGKIEPGEGPRAALARELKEELNIEARIDEWLARSTAKTPDGRLVILDVYAVTWTGGDMVPTDHDDLRWCDAATLPTLPWLDADIPILPAVITRLKG